MLVVVSPAKRLNEHPPRARGGSTPAMLDQAAQLAETARQLRGTDLERLMRISPRLGALNAERFAAFGTGAGRKQAVELFSGDTYLGLEAASLDVDERAYAQDHLCILSGLYGLLRPGDVIQPHRLEMGSRLATVRGRNLYDFWGDRIAKALNRRARSVGTGVLINCASVEYFKAVDPAALALRVVTPVFLEDRPEGPKVMSLWAKRARGAMARFVIQNRLRAPDGLRDFESGGYRFQPGLSEAGRMVFMR